MSDPMNRPVAPPPPPAAAPPPEGERKSASPLIWLLVLIALLAFGWYFYSQRSATTAPDVPPTPIGDGTTPDAEVAPAAGTTRTPPRTTPRAADTAGPSTRDAVAATRVEPEYPAELRRVSQEGSVVLTVDVDAAGKPSNVQVKQRGSDRAFDRAAVAAVEQWTFEPAMRDGKAVASQVEVPVDFRMQP